MNNRELAENNALRQVVQVGYATKDVKRTIKMMQDVLGFGPWEICTLTSDNATHVKIYGKRVTEPYFCYVAHCMVGGMDIEVLQPEYGPNAYSRFIEEHGEGIQHPKEKIAKEDLWDVTLDGEAAGGKLLLTGGIETDRFVYLDMQEMGGGIYELGNQPEGLVIEKDYWPLGEAREALRRANSRRQILQIGYIARDINRVMRTLYKCLRMGPWTVATLNEKNTHDFAVNGKKVTGPFACKVATCMLGDIQMEIIQPVEGLEPLDAYLERHGEGCHHVKEKVSTDTMMEFAKRMERLGIETAISGEINGEPFACYNLEKLGGSWYEISTGGYTSLPDLDTEVWPKA